MQLIADFWHPTLLLFLAIASVPILLFRRRRAFGRIDRGYNAILLGTIIVSFGAFIDYGEETVWGSRFLGQFLKDGWAGNHIPPFIYFPGIILVSLGVAHWMPAVYSVSREIDRRLQAEQELRGILAEVNDLAVRAEEANRSKSEFLATMSHELRTPLNAVIGFTEMMQQDLYSAPEKRQEYLEIVANSGHHLLSIINDILDLSKLESGKVSVDVQQFQIPELLDECLAYMEPRIQEKSLRVVINCEDTEITSDRRLIKQIVLNLLSNAVKFTHHAGMITLSAHRDIGDIMIEIADTGIGMAPDEIKRAMEPFMQVDNPLSRNNEGTGLGLPLVDRFTQLLKGDMHIWSQKGVGTRITLRVPCYVQTIIGPAEPKFI